MKPFSAVLKFRRGRWHAACRGWQDDYGQVVVPDAL
jgi:hypothetical protein